jgi:glycosyltransferase involved in cell wall biosynthesis
MCLAWLMPSRCDAMKLVSFVIHGNAQGTLSRCLQSLRASSDVIVAVDSGSTDGSFEVSQSLADVVVQKPWAGYGAARARAMVEVLKLSPHMVFFLDSDEWLPEPLELKTAATRAFLNIKSGFRVRRVTRENYVTHASERYLFFKDQRVRLFAPEYAAWSDAQIVHEAFKKGTYPLTNITIAHDFVNEQSQSLEVRSEKSRRYAALWAIQAFEEKRGLKNPGLQYWAQTLKYSILKGSLFRGGAHAWNLSRTQGRYAALKYEFLAALQAGQHIGWIQLYRTGHLEELMSQVALDLKKMGDISYTKVARE